MSEQKKKEINEKLDDIYDLLFLYFKSEGRDLTSEGFVEFNFYDYNLQIFKIGIGELLNKKIKELNILLDKLREENSDWIDEKIKSKIEKCYMISFSDNDINNSYIFSYINYRLAMELILYKNLKECEIVDFLRKTKDLDKSSFPIYFLFIYQDDKEMLIKLTKELDNFFNGKLPMIKIYGDLEMLNFKIEKIINSHFLDDYFKFASERLAGVFNLYKGKKPNKNKLFFENIGFSDLFSNATGYRKKNTLVLEVEHKSFYSIPGKFNNRFLLSLLKRLETFNYEVDEKYGKLKFLINPSKKKMRSVSLNKKVDLLSIGDTYANINFNQKEANKEYAIARKRLEDSIMNNFLEELDNPLRDANKYFDILKINESLKKRNVSFFEGIKYFLESPNAKERFLKDKVFNDEFLDLIELEKGV